MIYPNAESEIEEIFGFPSRVKLLHALANDPEKWHTAYSVAKETGLNFVTIRDNLTSLSKLGWIETVRATNKFRIEQSNEKVKLFIRLIREIDSKENPLE